MYPKRILLASTRQKAIMTLLVILLATACTGPVVVGTIYEGAAARLAKQAKSYAKFSTAEKNTIDKRFSQYHNWHRATQLPLYTTLIAQITTVLEQQESIDSAQVINWVGRIDHLSAALRHCNPLNRSTKFLANLDDRQVQQISNNLDQMQAERIAKYNVESGTQRKQRRHKEISKWLKRAGLSMNSEQSTLLHNTLAKQISMSRQRQLLWQQWIDQFVAFLKIRTQPNFAAAMNQHIDELWNLTESTYPQQWKSNKDLWSNFFHQFLQLQTTAQRQKMVNKMRKFAITLNKIGAKINTSEEAQCFGKSG